MHWYISGCVSRGVLYPCKFLQRNYLLELICICFSFQFQFKDLVSFMILPSRKCFLPVKLFSKCAHPYLSKFHLKIYSFGFLRYELKHGVLGEVFYPSEIWTYMSTIYEKMTDPENTLCCWPPWNKSSK